jgi:hypothetical protein
MTTIVFEDDQIRQMILAEPPIELVDPQGKFVARVELLDNETTREIREQLQIPLSKPASRNR